jgi:hypothetical protein
MTDRQAQRELEVFRTFASVCGLGIISRSVEKRHPTEPDVLCTLAEGEQVAFEMVQVEMARPLGDQEQLDNRFEEIYRVLAPEEQHQLPKKRIFIKLKPSEPLFSRTNQASKIIDQLILAGPNFEGELLLSLS